MGSDRHELTFLVIQILDGWGLTGDDQIRLLGLPEGTRSRVLQRHRKGQELPLDPGMMERIQLIVAIERALQSMFPHNPDLGRYWITSDNVRMGGETPLFVMLEQGLPGMRGILEHINGTGKW